MKEKVLFFNPHAGILEHLKIERDFARLVNQSGFGIEILRCDGFFKDNCSVMSAHGIHFQSPTSSKESICSSCRKSDSKSRNFQQGDFLHLEDLLSQAISDEVYAVMNQINQDNWSIFQLDGEFIGRFASYEFILRHKIVGTSIPDVLWEELKSDILHYLFTYFLALEWLRKSDYRYVGVYNFLYGVNRAFVVAATKLNISTFSIQGNGYLYNLHNSYMVYPTNSDYWYLNKSKKWSSHRNFPIKTLSAFRVFRHLKYLISARSVFTYSSPARSKSAEKTREDLRIPYGKQVHLLTTSSADELFAFGFVGLLNENFYSESSVFKSTKDWILHTIKIFSSQPEKFLVVRLHPREFANKRDSVNSSSGADLVDFLKSQKLPDNVIINLPEDKISLYDLAPITELLINSTSTVGLEFAALGVPSICVSPNTISAYPPDISTAIHSKEEYLEALSESRSREKMTARMFAYRWIVFKHESCSIKIPLIYVLFDRLYFGALGRFLVRFPVFGSSVNMGTNTVYRILNLFDRRRLKDFNTLLDYKVPKSKTSFREKLLLSSLEFFWKHQKK